MQIDDEPAAAATAAAAEARRAFCVIRGILTNILLFVFFFSFYR